MMRTRHYCDLKLTCVCCGQTYPIEIEWGEIGSGEPQPLIEGVCSPCYQRGLEMAISDVRYETPLDNDPYTLILPTNHGAERPKGA